MPRELRRIVTGHNASGKAIVVSDDRLPPIGRREIWSTDAMPVDLTSDAAMAAQREGFVKRFNYVGTGQGTVLRITELEPGNAKFMHRTETLDYAILMDGTCDLELDGGEVVHLKAGDIVVQRGTIHAWINRGTTPCTFAFILIDAKAAEAGGEVLRTHYPR